jgi:hypothetical protein
MLHKYNFDVAHHFFLCPMMLLCLTYCRDWMLFSTVRIWQTKSFQLFVPNDNIHNDSSFCQQAFASMNRYLQGKLCIQILQSILHAMFLHMESVTWMTWQDAYFVYFNCERDAKFAKKVNNYYERGLSADTKMFNCIDFGKLFCKQLGFCQCFESYDLYKNCVGLWS